MDFTYFFLGALITLVVSHLYFKRSGKEQFLIYNKLSDELKKIILNDQREKLTVKELNELLKEKTIDPNSKEIFPFKCCPKCGSDNIVHDTDHIVDVDVGDFGEPMPYATPYKKIYCYDCSWEKDELNLFSPSKDI